MELCAEDENLDTLVGKYAFPQFDSVLWLMDILQLTRITVIIYLYDKHVDDPI